MRISRMPTSRLHKPASRPDAVRGEGIMNLSRNTLIAIIIVMAAIAAASLAGLIHQRNKAGSVEINLDKGGIRIEGN
jgi:hypothetical protein